MRQADLDLGVLHPLLHFQVKPTCDNGLESTLSGNGRPGWVPSPGGFQLLVFAQGRSCTAPIQTGVVRVARLGAAGWHTMEFLPPEAVAGTVELPTTLAIDIGGSGLKMVVLGPGGRQLNERSRQATPRPATPEAVFQVLRDLLACQPEFDRVAAGFPGVVRDGVTLTAFNLDKNWVGFDFRSALEQLTGKPARVANDADVQGLAVINGAGLELVLTLGTGLGSALYIDGRLVPNMEIAHHVFRKCRTYEDCLGYQALVRYGKAKWNRRLIEAIEQLEHAFNYDRLYIGGGNSGKVAKQMLPDNVTVVSNAAGLLGCMHLWNATHGRSSSDR